MRYMRVEENAMDHPKFIAINAGAWRLWCEGGTYCQKHLTDGFVPGSALKGFRYYSASALKQLLEALVPGKGPLWHRVASGIQVHDYLDHNDAREKVLKMRGDAKDRLDRWKAEQAAKRAPTRNALPNASQNASPDGAQNLSKRNGTEQNDPPERAPEESVTPARASRGMGSGVMAGALPREHLRHAFCGRKCVPDFLHGEFVQSVGGADPEAAVKAFYVDAMDAIPADVPIGDEPVKFWRTQFAARFGSASGPVGKTAGNRAAGAQWLEKRRNTR